MKKLYTFAIAAAALLSAFTAHAGDKFVVDGIQYEVMADGSGVQVAPSTDPDGYTGDVTIPATVKNGNITYKVVGVGKKAFQWCEVGTVTLPNTVLIIDELAFNASDVEKVVLSSNLEVIKNGAFSVVKSLKDLSEIPASCTTIEGGAFMMTNSLAEFKISAENPAYKSVNGAILTKSGKTLLAVPYGMTVKEFVIPEGCDTIANDTFNTFMDLEKITFSSTLKHIGLSAFTYCNKMVNTNDFPETLELIGASAFSSCYKLQNLTVGPNVKMVGGMAFNNAITPVKVHVGSTTTLGANAFSSGRSVIKEIIFDTPAEGYTTIPTFAFQYAQIEEINVPEGFEIIEGRAFAQTTKVKTIDLPSTLKELGIAPFEKDAPDTLICRATTPPVYNNYNNANYPLVVKTAFETTKLFVPDASIDQYKEANGWKDIVNVLPLSQLSGVQDVVADDAVKTVATENFYDLNGREVAPSVEKKGLYIVRTTYTDGSVKTAKKVF